MAIFFAKPMPAFYDERYMSNQTMKIILSYCDEALLCAVNNALISFDIVGDVEIENKHSDAHQALGIVICDETGEAASSKSYPAPLRLGRVLDDVAMVLKSACAAPRLTLGNYVLDVAQNRLVFGDESARLTDRETDVLVYLHRHSPQVISREALLRDIWGYAETAETHTLETHIYRLRQKIAGLGGAELLLTQDAGYCLRF